MTSARFSGLAPAASHLCSTGEPCGSGRSLILLFIGSHPSYSVPLAPKTKVDHRRFDVVVFSNFYKTDFIRHVVASHRGCSPKKQVARGKQVKDYTHHPKIRTYMVTACCRSARSRRRPWPVPGLCATSRLHPFALSRRAPVALRVITGPGEPKPCRLWRARPKVNQKRDAWVTE